MRQRIAAGMPSTVSNRVQDQGLLPELAPDAVSQVLQHVQQQQRLGACAHVSHVWRAAANTATTVINYQIPTSDKQPSLSPWPGKHGSSVKTLAIHSDTPPPHMLQKPDDAAAFMLPFGQLSQLHSLSITHVHLQPVEATTAVAAAALSSEQAAAAPNSLATLTALTSLQLSSSALDLSPLAACTSLRHLKLKYMADSTRQAAELDSLLNGALQQLVHLTHLDVNVLYGDVLTDAAFEHLSCLQQLQELQITSTYVTTATLVGLPLSVSRLDLELGPGTGAVETVVFSSSSTPRLLQQLTALQHLGVSSAQLDPALLVGLTQLRQLQLHCIPNPPGTAALLSQLAKLTQLQHLDLDSALQDAAAVAAYSALTASSQLSHLDLNDCFIPAGASKHIFSAGRQLSQLAMLAVEGDLFPSPGDIQHMVSCCPALQSLEVWGQYSDVRLDAAALAALQQLTRLTQLQMSDIFPLDAAAAAQLATLTTLQELCIIGAEQLTPAGLLQLTQLTGLTKLEVINHSHDGEQIDISVELHSKAPEGCAPDVWQQLHCLLEECYCLEHSC